MSQCAAATDIPIGILKTAKKNGCPGFVSTRVRLFAFLKWWFAQAGADANTNWSDRLRRAQALSEEINLEAKRGNVIDSSDVNAFAARYQSALFHDLDRIFANEFPAAVKGLDENAVRARALKEIAAFKVHLSEMFERWKGEKKLT